MGATLSSVLQGNQDVDETVKESLRQFEELGLLAADNFRFEVRDMYKNPGNFNKWQVVGGRQDREDTFIAALASKQPADSVDLAVDALMGGLFGKGKEQTDKLRELVIDFVKTGSNAFLGNASAGSHRHTTFLIIPHGYAFHRVDVRMYKYNFRSEAFTKHCESLTVVYACRGILSIDNLSSSELLSYLSETYGEDQSKIEGWLRAYNEMKTLVQMITEHKRPPSNTEGDEGSQQKKLKTKEASAEIN